MSDDLMLKCLVCFILGYFLCKMMGNGFSVGGDLSSQAQLNAWLEKNPELTEEQHMTIDDVKNLCIPSLSKHSKNCPKNIKSMNPTQQDMYAKFCQTVLKDNTDNTYSSVYTSCPETCAKLSPHIGQLLIPEVCKKFYRDEVKKYMV